MTDELLDARKTKARIQSDLESNKLDTPIAQVLAIAFIAGGLARITTDLVVGTLLLVVGILGLFAILGLTRRRNRRLQELLDQEHIILEHERSEEIAKQSRATEETADSATAEPPAPPEASESNESAILRPPKDTFEEGPTARRGRHSSDSAAQEAAD